MAPCGHGDPAGLPAHVPARIHPFFLLEFTAQCSQHSGGREGQKDQQRVHGILFLQLQTSLAQLGGIGGGLQAGGEMRSWRDLGWKGP